MTNQNLRIHIRIALLSLGRSPEQVLPRDKPALQEMLKRLRAEQIERGLIKTK